MEKRIIQNITIYDAVDSDIGSDDMLKLLCGEEQFVMRAEIAVAPMNSPCAGEPSDYLLKEGFFFADRTTGYSIPLQKLEERLKRMVRFEFRWEAEPDAMKKIAAEAFRTDRRFHLHRAYDMNEAAVISAAYIDKLLSEGGETASIYHEGKYIGFNVFKLEGSLAVNLLGAVSPEYWGTLAPGSLYLAAAFGLRDMGCRKLKGQISTRNTASLNLHLSLGSGHTVLEEGRDIYIYDRTDTRA